MHKLFGLAIVFAFATSDTNASDILVTNNEQCTTVGRDLLAEGASVEQTYVAVSLCEGLVHPMDSGIGGGFQALVHHDRRRSFYLMAREYSPRNVSFLRTPFVLGNSVGVPAVLAGYAKLLGVWRCVNHSSTNAGAKPTSSLLHQRTYEYDGNCVNKVLSGKIASGLTTDQLSGIPYAKIFAPIVKLARYGFRVSPTLNDVLARQTDRPLFLRALVRTDSEARVTNERLAVFLDHLSQDPLRLVDPYVRWRDRRVDNDRNVRSIMLTDVRTFGSLLTERDFLSYRATVRRPLSISFTVRDTRYKLTTIPTPAGGETIAFFAKMVERVNKLRARETLNDVQLSCLFIALSKYAFAVKPYFRQWTPTLRRRVIVRDAPTIAKKLYNDIVVRTDESSLMNYLSVGLPGIPTSFGATVVPKIRVAPYGQRTRSSLARAAEATALNDHQDDERDETLEINAIEYNDAYDVEEEQTPSAYDEETTMIERVNNDLSNTQSLPTINATIRSNLIVGQGADHDLEDEMFSDNDDNDYDSGYTEALSGTTNVIVKRGNRTIVATSSINHSFGSLIFSQNLGIPYNNVLRDFTPYTWYLQRSTDGNRISNRTRRRVNTSVPSTTTRRPTAKSSKQTDHANDETLQNHPRPHSVPQSSMGCTIISNTETGYPVFGIGAAGGFKITSAIMNVMWNYFVHGDTLSRAVNRLRLITKLNYKSGRTEIWHEFPTDSKYYAKLKHDTGLLYTGPTYSELNFDESKETRASSGNERRAGQIDSVEYYHRAHSPRFFYRYRDELQVKYIFEAGYSAVTVFSTLAETKPRASFDPRRGGSVYVKE